MNTVRVDLSFDQIQQALRRLPPQQKIALWRLLDKELDRSAIARKFETTIKAIRKAYVHISEDEVMADAVKVTHAVRHAKNRP